MSDANTSAYTNLYHRDLDRLADEVRAIPEELLWKSVPGIKNSCGVLTQHLVGNLRHYIGAELGNTGYVRDRERELSDTDARKQNLVDDIKELKVEIENVLSSLDEEELAQPLSFKFPFKATVNEALLHLYGHLNYHLGQLNYLRRMIQEKG